VADVRTTYLGLTLKNPLVVASSGLTRDVEGIKKHAEAGAAAAVVKSLFEEQIDYDARNMIEGIDHSSHADAFDFLTHASKDYYIDSYLETVERAKDAVNIPIIASVNCKSDGAWIEYADRFEAVGADALELNVFVVPSDETRSSEEIEQIYLDILSKVQREVSIPVALKIGPHFTSMAGFMKRLDEGGADGLVLFNRFYKTDIDVNYMVAKSGSIMSVPEEAAVPLQWTALMAGRLACDICSNTGIHDGDGVIKQLLAGAKCVQLCSAILKNGSGVLSEMERRLEQWMEEKQFDTIESFRGKLSFTGEGPSDVWERSQYIKAICGIS